MLANFHNSFTVGLSKTLSMKNLTYVATLPCEAFANSLHSYERIIWWVFFLLTVYFVLWLTTRIVESVQLRCVYGFPLLY